MNQFIESIDINQQINQINSQKEDFYLTIFALKVIMDRTTNESCNLKRNLGFKLHDVINTKEQSVLKSIKDTFEGEDMQTQNSKLNKATEFIFMITSLQQKLKNLVIMIEILTMKYKDKKQQKKNLVVKLLELTLMSKILKFLKP